MKLCDNSVVIDFDNKSIQEGERKEKIEFNVKSIEGLLKSN